MNIPFRGPNPFIPALMQQSDDDRWQAFWAAVPENLRNTLRANWNAIPPMRRRQLFGPQRPVQAPGLEARLKVAARQHETARAEKLASKRALLRRETARALAEGVGRYQPTAGALAEAPDIGLLVQQRLAGLTEKDPCVCPEPDQDPPQNPRYSVKAKRVRCEMKDETSAHDEVYLVTTAVDGNGAVVVRQSSVMSMNAGDDDRASPNHYVYPPGDPAGFLDIAIALWEDDGGYEAVGEMIASMGAAIAMIPDPRTLGAGVALQVVGGLVVLASFLDDDDNYGTGSKTWSSASQLRTGVGSRSFQYYDPDTGWLDTRGWHYFVDYELRSHQA